MGPPHGVISHDAILSLCELLHIQPSPLVASGPGGFVAVCVRSAPRPGAAPSGTARSWRGIVAVTHLAREGRMTVTIGRRQLLAALGGAVAAWPLAARAQQSGKRPIVGFLGDSTPLAESERAAAFARRLHDLGWIEGRTIAIEYRWAD